MCVHVWCVRGREGTGGGRTEADAVLRLGHCRTRCPCAEIAPRLSGHVTQSVVVGGWKSQRDKRWRVEKNLWWWVTRYLAVNEYSYGMRL